MRELVLLTGEGMSMSREEIMQELQDLFTSCFVYAINPLPSLRKLFPAFEWKFWKMIGSPGIEADERLRRRLADEADFAWRVSSFEFVSARQRADRGKYPVEYVRFMDWCSAVIFPVNRINFLKIISRV